MVVEINVLNTWNLDELANSLSAVYCTEQYDLSAYKV